MSTDDNLESHPMSDESIFALHAISPLEGRYRKRVKDLQIHFSELALITSRVEVEVEYLLALSHHRDVPARYFNDAECKLLERLKKVSTKEADIIKQIETTGWGPYEVGTNHDVKAVELYLRHRLENTSLGDEVEWLHFGLTSEDVNNIAYGLMLRRGISGVIVPAILGILGELDRFRTRWDTLPMLARTHGQPATPTTLGKEFNVFRHRILVQLKQLREYRISVKLNGASGNYNAQFAALPNIDWPTFAQRFAERFNDEGLGRFRFNSVTTQIEPHDTYAELFDIVRRLNTIIIDLCQDVWRYVSDDWLTQKPKAGEVGSSTMPHKVNPIDLENAEGNLGVANALLEFFSRKLPVSRLQRDLSDSTVERNFGVALGYCLVAYDSTARGLAKMSANEAKITAALRGREEVLTEAIQTILRREGYPNAYDALKGLARGKEVTPNDIMEFVEKLDVSRQVKNEILMTNPEDYIGLAPWLARL